MNIRKVLLTSLIALVFLGSLAGAGAAGELSESSAIYGSDVATVPTSFSLIFTEPAMADVLSDAPAIVHRSFALPTVQALIRSAATAPLSGASGLGAEFFFVGDAENQDTAAWQLSGMAVMSLDGASYPGAANQALTFQTANQLSGAAVSGADLATVVGTVPAEGIAQVLAGGSVLSKEAILIGDTENKGATAWYLSGASAVPLGGASYPGAANQARTLHAANQLSGAAVSGAALATAVGTVPAEGAAQALTGGSILSKEALLIGDTENKGAVESRLADGVVWTCQAEEGPLAAAPLLSGASAVSRSHAADLGVPSYWGVPLSGTATLNETPATGAKAEARVVAHDLAGGSVLSKEALLIGDTEKKDTAAVAGQLSGTATLNETPATVAKVAGHTVAYDLAGSSVLSKEALLIGDTEKKDNGKFDVAIFT